MGWAIRVHRHCERNEAIQLSDVMLQESVARMERSVIRDYRRIVFPDCAGCIRASHTKQKPRPVGGPDGALLSGSAAASIIRTFRSGD